MLIRPIIVKYCHASGYRIENEMQHHLWVWQCLKGEAAGELKTFNTFGNLQYCWKPSVLLETFNTVVKPSILLLNLQYCCKTFDTVVKHSILL